MRQHCPHGRVCAHLSACNWLVKSQPLLANPRNLTNLFPARTADSSTVYAIEAASLHPAKCLGIERQKGTLDFDSDADFILLDDQLQLLSTWIGGVCVHNSRN